MEEKEAKQINTNEKEASLKHEQRLALLRKVYGIVGKVLYMGLLPCALGLFFGAARGLFIYNNYVSDVETSMYREITLDYARPITLDLFFDEVPDSAYFITDISTINTAQIGVYPISISVDGKPFDTVLNIVDRTSPVGYPVPQEMYARFDPIPDPAKTVENVFDLSGYEVQYDDPDQDFVHGGEIEIPVRLTDPFGNISVVNVPFYIKDDHNAPIIVGAHDLMGVVNQNVDYLSGVTAKDDFDPAPEITVDTSQVNTHMVGTYPVTYTAKDEVGNTRSVTVNVSMYINRSAGVRGAADQASVERVYRMAREIYRKICRANMTDVQKALAIFYWVHHNIGFAHGTSDYTAWSHAAIKAFTYRHASCYGQWACCKALLDVAGIENICVTRYPKSAYNGRVHYWSLVKLNGEWYHCDATTWQASPGYFIFMMTDSEVARAAGNHSFQKSAYPARSTRSVQSYINIYNHTVSSNFPYRRGG